MKDEIREDSLDGLGRVNRAGHWGESSGVQGDSSWEQLTEGAGPLGRRNLLGGIEALSGGSVCRGSNGGSVRNGVKRERVGVCATGFWY